jgi:CxxC motif-containing protein (DUF1111 family)
VRVHWIGCALGVALALAGCTRGPGEEAAEAVVEPGEELAGGATTVHDVSANAFGHPARNLRAEVRTAFFVGNSFFRQNWVVAPASTSQRDGLGPLFNARSCSACHFKDGRGEPPAEGAEMVSMLLRLSRDGQPDPDYGGQLQNHAVHGALAEGTPMVRYTEVAGEFPDGTSYKLLKPEYRIEGGSFGDPAGLEISPRIAPAMIGLGLLAAIPEADILARADPDDANNDGISGRPNRVLNQEAGEVQLGRFGWKANVATVREQVAGAFLGDMGLTSVARPTPGDGIAEKKFAGLPTGGDPEIDAEVLAPVVFYSEVLAVPARRDVADPQVLAGKSQFSRVGCAACHVPKSTTGAAELPELANQTIFPFTDLLLHDMGEELADHRSDFEAGGREWRTPPLWGIGLVKTVSGHTRFLHDGRARNLEEAILWHAGEATAAREAYMNLPAADRAALLRFLGTL